MVMCINLNLIYHLNCDYIISKVFSHFFSCTGREKGRTIPHFTDMETEAPGHVVRKWSNHNSFLVTFRSGHKQRREATIKLCLPPLAFLLPLCLINCSLKIRIQMPPPPPSFYCCFVVLFRSRIWLRVIGMTCIYTLPVFILPLRN